MEVSAKQALEECLNSITEVFSSPADKVAELQSVALKDFKKIEVLYLCSAGGKEEFCIDYSPGPAGNCTFQDLSVIVNNTPVCRKANFV